VSDPTHPGVVGTVIDPQTLSNAYSLFVSDGYAFVAAPANNALTVVDVHDPAKPMVVGSVSDTSRLGAAIGVDVQNGRAYVAADCRVDSGGQPRCGPGV